MDTKARNNIVKRSFIFSVLCFLLPYSVEAQIAEYPLGSSPGLYFNMWVEEPGQPSRPVMHMEPNRAYRIVVDVAIVDYADRYSVFSFNPPRSIATRVKRPDDVLSALRYDGGLHLVQIATEQAYFTYSDDPKIEGPDYEQFTAKKFSPSVDDVSEFNNAAHIPVNKSAFEILRSDSAGLLSLHRVTFDVQTLGKTGDAPLGATLWIGKQIAAHISSRFCVAGQASAASLCIGLPRHSERFFYPDNLPNPYSYWYPTRQGLPPTPGPPLPTGPIGPPDLPIPPEYPEIEVIPQWNSWFTRRYASSGEILKQLEAQDPYEPGYSLHLDLSSFIYEKYFKFTTGTVPRASVDPSFAEILKDVSKVTTRYPVVARAMVIGDALEVVNGREQKSDIVLARLNQVPAVKPSLGSPVRNLAMLSQNNAALSLKIDLNAKKPGCAAVLVSVTGENGVRPLDHVIRRVRVVDKNGQGPVCDEEGLPSIESGLASRLAVWKAPRLDAAFHVVEFSLGGKTAAAFYIQSDGEYHYWQLQRPLTEYLADPQNLQARINDARGKPQGAYDIAANELAGVLFAAPSEYRKEAKAALTALKKLIDNSTAPPTVLARLVGVDGDLFFMPLNILGASGKNRVLTKPIRVVQPLPKENYLDRGCINSWAFAISDELKGPQITVPNRITTSPSWIGPGLSDLRKYFSSDVTPKSEGIVIVAHHANGRIRYKDADTPLQAHELRRQFAPGSAGILAMCGAGAAIPVQNRLIKILNDSGLEAAVVSPFSLSADYGKAFAIEYALAVEKANASNNQSPPSFADLFDRVVKETRNRLMREMQLDVGDMELELLIVGNQDLTLCEMGDSQ